MIKVDMSDYLITTFRNGSNNVRMTISHIPSGIFVTGEGIFESKLKSKLMIELLALLTINGEK